MSMVGKPNAPIGVLTGPNDFLDSNTPAATAKPPTGIVEGPIIDIPPATTEPAPPSLIEPLRPTHLTVWLLAIGCIMFVLARAVAVASSTIREMFQMGSVIGWGFVASLVLAVITTGLAVLRLTTSYRALRVVDHLRLALDATDPMADKMVRGAICDYLRELRRVSCPAGRGSTEIADSISRLEVRFREAGADRRSDIESLKEYVLQPIDQQVDQIIVSQAVQNAVATALANQTLDPLLVAWHALRLADRISRAYGARANAWGTLQLTRHALAMVAFAPVADMAGELAGKLFAQRLMGLLGSRAAEGFGNGLLMLRFGHAVKSQCRPIVDAPCPTKSLAETLSDGIRRTMGNNPAAPVAADA